MSWLLKSLWRRAVGFLLLFELIEHLVLPALLVAVGRVLTA